MYWEPGFVEGPLGSLVSQELPGYAGASRYLVGQGPKFLEVHKEPPSIMGTGLLLGGLLLASVVKLGIHLIFLLHARLPGLGGGVMG